MGIIIYIHVCTCVPRLCRSHRYNPVHNGMHIGVAIGYIIQGAGCRVQVQGELVMLKVYVHVEL